MRNNLNDLMDFDHVIRVNEDGTVSDADSAIWAPEVTMADDIRRPHISAREGQSWTLLNGYSGQFRYAGPVMHESEFIGGRMADDILAEPGVYVAVTVSDDDGEIDGWAVARLDD